jgi:hypothetical protein
MDKNYVEDLKTVITKDINLRELKSLNIDLKAVVDYLDYKEPRTYAYTSELEKILRDRDYNKFINFCFAKNYRILDLLEIITQKDFENIANPLDIYLDGSLLKIKEMESVIDKKFEKKHIKNGTQKEGEKLKLTEDEIREKVKILENSPTYRKEKLKCELILEYLAENDISIGYNIDKLILNISDKCFENNVEYIIKNSRLSIFDLMDKFKIRNEEKKVEILNNYFLKDEKTILYNLRRCLKKEQLEGFDIKEIFNKIENSNIDCSKNINSYDAKFTFILENLMYIRIITKENLEWFIDKIFNMMSKSIKISDKKEDYYYETIIEKKDYIGRELDPEIKIFDERPLKFILEALEKKGLDARVYIEKFAQKIIENNPSDEGKFIAENFRKLYLDTVKSKNKIFKDEYSM